MPVIKAENKAHFIELVKNDKVVVDFYGMWCEPCKKLLSNVDKILEKFPDVTFVKVDVNDLDDIAEEFKVESIPHLVFFKKGKLQTDYMQNSDYNVIMSHMEKVFNSKKDHKEKA
jgi:thioredoxin 1